MNHQFRLRAGSSVLGMAPSIASNNPALQPVAATRHRGRELTLKAPTVEIKARQGGKTERA